MRRVRPPLTPAPTARRTPAGPIRSRRLGPSGRPPVQKGITEAARNEKGGVAAALIASPPFRYFAAVFSAGLTVPFLWMRMKKPLRSE